MKRELYYIIMLLLLTAGCKHTYEKENFLGPEYAAAPDGFSVAGNTFTASPDPVDFTATPVNFNATLSHRVSWTVTITGKNSGAVKEVKGLTDVLNSTTATWDGSSDNMKFFKTGESCEMVLTILGSDIRLIDSLVIFKSKNYDGVLIADFNGGGIINNPSWWYYYSDSASGTAEITANGFVTTPLTAAQGNGYLHQKGEDLDNDWFIGGLGYWYDAGLDTKLTAMSSNPDDLYLNAFINSNGNTTTIVNFSIFEATGPTRDIFFKNVTVNWTGWKLVSLKLSGFSRHPNSVGNGVMDVGSLKTMEMVPAPTAMGATCEMNLDYIIFTKGAPFRP